MISMENEMIVRSLKALADPTRFHILRFLSECCCGRAAVHEDGGVEGATAGTICCHITGAEKITSTVSHHLHELESVGLIEIARKGKTMVCSLNPKALLQVAEQLSSLASGENQNGCC